MKDYQMCQGLSLMFSNDNNWDTFTDDIASLRSILLAKNRIGSRRCLISRHKHKQKNHDNMQHDLCKLQTTNNTRRYSAHLQLQFFEGCILPRCTLLGHMASDACFKKAQTFWQALGSPPTLYIYLKLQVEVAGEAEEQEFKQFPTNTVCLCLVRIGCVK